MIGSLIIISIHIYFYFYMPGNTYTFFDVSIYIYAKLFKPLLIFPLLHNHLAMVIINQYLYQNIILSLLLISFCANYI